MAVRQLAGGPRWLPPYRRLILDEAIHLEDVAAMHLARRSACSRASGFSPGSRRTGAGCFPTLRSVLFRRDDLLSAPSRELAQQGLSDALAAAAPRGGRRLHPAGARLDGEPGPAPVLRLATSSSPTRCGTKGWAWRSTPAARFSRLSEGAAMIADRVTARRCLRSGRAQLTAELHGVVRAAGRRGGGVSRRRWAPRRGARGGPLAGATRAEDAECLPRRRATRPGAGSQAEPVRPDRDGSAHERHARGGRRTSVTSRSGSDSTCRRARTKVREIHASPFDLRLACLFGIPTDLPEPRDDESGHGAAVARVLLELAHASDGGMFVLFTSHAALRRAADAVRDAIGGRWPLFRAGRRAARPPAATLPGGGARGFSWEPTRFWEGVDVPGRALRVLIPRESSPSRYQRSRSRPRGWSAWRREV